MDQYKKLYDKYVEELVNSNKLKTEYETLKKSERLDELNVKNCLLKMKRRDKKQFLNDLKKKNYIYWLFGIEFLVVGIFILFRAIVK